jgi:PII-like signaling protein
MRLYLSQSHRVEGRPLHEALLGALLDAGFAGGTTFIGTEGYGQHRNISAASAVDAPGDMPVVIEVVEQEERILAFMGQLEALLYDGLVTCEPIEIMRYDNKAE